jgi:hypothetical protein
MLLSVKPTVAQTTAATDEQVFEAALSGDAFVELRCRGLSAERAKEHFRQAFGERQRRIRDALKARRIDLPEVIPIGRRCPFYRGARKRLAVALEEADGRLQGLSPNVR